MIEYIPTTSVHIHLVRTDDRSRYFIVNMYPVKGGVLERITEEFTVLNSDTDNGMKRMFDFIAHKLDETK